MTFIGVWIEHTPAPMAPQTHDPMTHRPPPNLGEATVAEVLTVHAGLMTVIAGIFWIVSYPVVLVAIASVVLTLWARTVLVRRRRHTEAPTTSEGHPKRTTA